MSKLKSNYIILPESNLVIEYHEGIIEIESYIKFKNKLFEDISFTPNLNYLIHFKNVTFSASTIDIEKFTNYMAKNSKNLGKRKIAFITSTPNQVVPTTIYKGMQDEFSQKMEIFTLERKAFEWLNPKKISYTEFITQLNKLIG